MAENQPYMLDKLEEEQVVNWFREIRAACGLLICAAENTTHQLLPDGMYFVANSISDRVDEIEKFMKSKEATNA